MLEGPHTTTSDAPDPSDVVLVSRDLLDRLQGELKFKQTRIDALNFEVARLKRWRFGSSSESLDTSTQAVLFDSLLIDTALEDRAADEASKSPASPRRAKGQAVRQALPASLPRPPVPI
jgi:transposase